MTLKFPSWKKKQLMAINNGPLYLNPMGTGAATLAGTAVGLYPGGTTTTVAYPAAQVVDTRITYKIEKIENGWLLYYQPNPYTIPTTYFCETPRDVGDRVVTCLVETKLEK